MKKHTAAIERPLTSPRIDRFASCAGASFLGPRSRRSPPPPPPQGSIHLLKIEKIQPNKTNTYCIFCKQMYLYFVY